MKAEHEKKGFDGRFGAGLPRISDGSFLFLQHMIAKMKRDNGGSRIAIVFLILGIKLCNPPMSQNARRNHPVILIDYPFGYGDNRGDRFSLS